jgi:hypothetical protein
MMMLLKLTVAVLAKKDLERQVQPENIKVGIRIRDLSSIQKVFGISLFFSFLFGPFRPPGETSIVISSH